MKTRLVIRYPILKLFDANNNFFNLHIPHFVRNMPIKCNLIFSINLTFQIQGRRFFHERWLAVNAPSFRMTFLCVSSYHILYKNQKRQYFYGQYTFYMNYIVAKSYNPFVPNTFLLFEQKYYFDITLSKCLIII